MATKLSVLWLDDVFRAPLTGELRHRVHTLLRRGEREIVLDMSRVSTIDAAGVGQLVRAYNVAAAAKGELRIVHVAPRVREPLVRAGLFHLLSGVRNGNNRSQRMNKSNTGDLAQRLDVVALLDERYRR